MERLNLEGKIDWKELRKNKRTDVGAVFMTKKLGNFPNVSPEEAGIPKRYLDLFVEIIPQITRYGLKEEFQERDFAIPFKIEETAYDIIKILTRHYRFNVCDAITRREWYDANAALQQIRHPHILPPSLQGIKEGLGYVVYLGVANDISDIMEIEVSTINKECGKE